MDAAKFKQAFGDKTHAVFGKWTFDDVEECDGEDWAKVLTPVLTQICEDAGYKARSSRQEGDSPYFLIYTNGNEESRPQAYIAHAIHREDEYGSDGGMALLAKCARTSASVRVAIGCSKNKDEALRHGKYLVKKFIEQDVCGPPTANCC